MISQKLDHRSDEEDQYNDDEMDKYTDQYEGSLEVDKKES